jgi:hypothetical protein
VNGEGVLKALASLSRIVMGRIGERADLSPDAGSGDAVAAEETATVEIVAPPADPGGSPEELILYSMPGECTPTDTKSAGATPSDGQPRVVIVESGVHVEGCSLRIPLEVSTANGVQRLMVSVMVVPE